MSQKRLGSPDGSGGPAGIGAAIAAAFVATQPIRDANEKRFEGVTPGDPHNQGRAKVRTSNQAILQQFLEQRRQLGILSDEASSTGTSAGAQAGEGVATGRRNSGAKIEAEGQGIMSRIKALFSTGVDIPVRIQGGSTSTPGASKPAPAGDKVSSAPISIRNNVTVHATGDATEIARQVSAKVAESAKASMRGPSPTMPDP